MPAPSEAAIESLSAKGHMIPSDSVRYVLKVCEGRFVRFDLQSDGAWLESPSITKRAGSGQ
jgi:hypothetical protein